MGKWEKKDFSNAQIPSSVPFLFESNIFLLFQEQFFFLLNHKFTPIYKLSKILPVRVKHSLPPFPSKAIFNKSVIFVEKRRIHIERFFRALIQNNYIQRRLYILRGLGLDQVDLSVDKEPEAVERPLSAHFLIPERKDQRGSTNTPLHGKSVQIPSESPLSFISEQTRSGQPLGSHRNPLMLGQYTLLWKIVDSIEPFASLQYASNNNIAYFIKTKSMEFDKNSLQPQFNIHKMVPIQSFFFSFFFPLVTIPYLCVQTFSFSFLLVVIFLGGG